LKGLLENFAIVTRRRDETSAVEAVGFAEIAFFQEDEEGIAEAVSVGGKSILMVSRINAEGEAGILDAVFVHVEWVEDHHTKERCYESDRDEKDGERNPHPPFFPLAHEGALRAPFIGLRCGIFSAQSLAPRGKGK
jgi:hypothetical protein